jgi:hypothetical protein
MPTSDREFICPAGWRFMRRSTVKLSESDELETPTRQFSPSSALGNREPRLSSAARHTHESVAEYRRNGLAGRKLKL